MCIATCNGANTPLGRHPPPPRETSPRYYGIWSTSGQYASYWNAFLLGSVLGNVFQHVSYFWTQRLLRMGPNVSLCFVVFCVFKKHLIVLCFRIQHVLRQQVQLDVFVGLNCLNMVVSSVFLWTCSQLISKLQSVWDKRVNYTTGTKPRTSTPHGSTPEHLHHMDQPQNIYATGIKLRMCIIHSSSPGLSMQLSTQCKQG